MYNKEMIKLKINEYLDKRIPIKDLLNVFKVMKVEELEVFTEYVNSLSASHIFDDIYAYKRKQIKDELSEYVGVMGYVGADGEIFNFTVCDNIADANCKEIKFNITDNLADLKNSKEFIEIENRAKNFALIKGLIEIYEKLEIVADEEHYLDESFYDFEEDFFDNEEFVQYIPYVIDDCGEMFIDCNSFLEEDNESFYEEHEEIVVGIGFFNTEVYFIDISNGLIINRYSIDNNLLYNKDEFVKEIEDILCCFLKTYQMKINN